MSNNTKPAGASIRVYRGGSWNCVASICRAANRFGVSPGRRNVFLGFRPAIRVTKQHVKQR